MDSGTRGSLFKLALLRILCCSVTFLFKVRTQKIASLSTEERTKVLGIAIGLEIVHWTENAFWPVPLPLAFWPLISSGSNVKKFHCEVDIQCDQSCSVTELQCFSIKRCTQYWPFLCIHYHDFLRSLFQNEKEWERGSNLRGRRLASRTGGVSRSDHLAGSNRPPDELQGYVRTDTVDWGLGGGRKKGRKQAEEAARTNRRMTKKRMAAERTPGRDKYRRWRKRRMFLFTFWEWERARGRIEFTVAASSQPDCPGVSRSDDSASLKESARWRALGLRSNWHGRAGQLGWLRAAAVGSIPALALSHCQKVNKKFLFSLQHQYLSLHAVSRRMPRL